MATTNTNALVAGAGGEVNLPRQVSNEIWKAALESAVVPQLAKTTPVILGENAVPTLTKRPSAYIVGEGENKTGSELEIGSKSFRPIKAVVGTEVTMEALETNPASVLDSLSEEFSGALSRQIDLAVLHGRQAADGKQLAGQEYLTQNASEVALGTDLSQIDVKFWEGYGNVVNAGGNMTGLAADPRLTALVAQARDHEGRRIYPEVSMTGTGFGPFSALKTATATTVSGRADGSTDTGILGIGGDFEALRFGRALDIPLKKIEYGDPLGNGDLQRRNCVAFMAEIMFGWIVMDGTRFVKYTAGAADGGDAAGE